MPCRSSFLCNQQGSRTNPAQRIAREGGGAAKLIARVLFIRAKRGDVFACSDDVVRFVRIVLIV